MPLPKLIRKSLSAVFIAIYLCSSLSSLADNTFGPSPQRVDLPNDFHVGDNFEDSNGTEWTAVEEGTYQGERLFYFERFIGGGTDPDFLKSSQPSLISFSPDSSELSLFSQQSQAQNSSLDLSPNILPDFNQPLAPNANEIGFGKVLSTKMGTEKFDAWSRSVSSYLQDAKAIDKPIPHLAPYPSLSTDAVNADYLKAIDNFLLQAEDKITNLEKNLSIFTASQSSVNEDATWECKACDAIPSITNFSQEANRSAREISGFNNSGSPYAPGITPTAAARSHEFKMREGQGRAELERAYRRLDQSAPLSPQGKTARSIGLKAVDLADDAGAKNDLENFEIYKSIATVMADIAIGFSPLGVARDTYEAISGRGLIDGHNLNDFERGFAIFGAITLGVGSKIVLFSKTGSAIVSLAKTLGAGEKILGDMVHISAAAFGLGIRTKDSFRKALTIFKSEKGFIQAGESLERAVTFGLKTPAGFKLFAKIEPALNAMPAKIRPVLLHEGTAPNKIALIGRSMGNPDKALLGVRDVKAYLQKAPGVEIAIFERSPRAKANFKESLREYQKANGNSAARLPDEFIKTGLDYKENANWVEKHLAEGYTFLDVGNPNALSEVSAYYEMEKIKIMGWKK